LVIRLAVVALSGPRRRVSHVRHLANSAMKKNRFPGFAGCMKLMRKRSPATQEEGFHALLPHTSRFVEELMREFHDEKKHGLRCWLLELIGEARDQRTLSLLVEQLHSDDEALRYWAISGLRKLDTHEARKALFEAGLRAFYEGADVKSPPNDS
jgi:hypothetical protein